MLRTIRKYKNSVLGLVAIGLVAVAMSGFGVNFMAKRHEPFAIAIDDHHISFSDYYEERRNIEARYRRLLGDNFDELAKSLNLNVSEQAREKLINDYLLVRLAKDAGFYANVPPNVPAQDREQARNIAIEMQLARLMSDASVPSKKELRAAVEREDTKYTVEYLDLAPASFIKDVKVPSDAEIEKYYQDHQGDFLAPAKVVYDYAVLDPAKSLDLVEILPEDVDLYYNENSQAYVTEEELKLRQIQFMIPAKADTAKKDEIKKKAEDVLAKIKAGGNFEELAKVSSEAPGAAATGGEIGWTTRGKLPPAVDEIAFKLLPGENSEIIETPDSFRIVKVDEQKPSRQKELSEVRAEVENAIREREAPAWTASRARDLFDAFEKGSETLKDFAPKNGITSQSTAGALAAAADPAGIQGLSAKLLEFPEEKRQLVELDDKFVLAEVTQYQEPATEPLAAVKERIVQTLKTEAARQTAKDTAQKVLDEFAKGGGSSLKAVAAKLELSPQESKDLTRSRATGPFGNADIRTAVFGTNTAMEKPARYFENNGGAFIFQVTAIARPTAQDIDTRVPALEEQESRQDTEVLIQSILSKLKADAKIDVDPSIIGQS